MRSRQGITMFGKAHIVRLTIISYLLLLLSSHMPARAQDGPLFRYKTDPILFPCTTSNSQLLELSPPKPYFAGYMTTDYLEANPHEERGIAVRVTVSFSTTDRSVIQYDNYLAAGICVQGPDNYVHPLISIDWGYALFLVVDGATEYPYIEGEVWKCYEWGRNGIYPLESPDADLVSAWTWSYPGVLTIDSSVTLSMKWNSTHLNYYATIGQVEYLLHSYLPEATELHYFMLGTCTRVNETRVWPVGIVRLFQFPCALSKYNIGRGHWRSHVSHPSFEKTESSNWENVRFAYSTDGPNAWLDHTLVWGGGIYYNVSALYYRDHIYAYYDSVAGTLAPDTLLWAPPPESPIPPPYVGGCPFVYSWNGSQYTIDNNILPASEKNNGADVADYYKLEKTPVPNHEGEYLSLYSFLIKEFEHEHSYIDQAKLLAIDHESNIKAGVSSNGTILTYRNPFPPESATNSLGENLLTPLNRIDGEYYEGFNGDCLMLSFGRVSSQNAKLIMRTDPPYKVSIHVQVSDSNGNWIDVATIIPRVYWATDIADLSTYLPNPDTDFKVRLYFTATHKIDFVGLDTSPQENYTMISAMPISAIHSTEGNVLSKLILNDQTYTELFPGQEIALKFLLPNCHNQCRTLVFYTEGRYFTIP